MIWFLLICKNKFWHGWNPFKHETIFAEEKKNLGQNKEAFDKPEIYFRKIAEKN